MAPGPAQAGAEEARAEHEWGKMADHVQVSSGRSGGLARARPPPSRHPRAAPPPRAAEPRTARPGQARRGPGAQAALAGEVALPPRCPRVPPGLSPCIPPRLPPAPPGPVVCVHRVSPRCPRRALRSLCPGSRGGNPGEKLAQSPGFPLEAAAGSPLSPPVSLLLSPEGFGDPLAAPGLGIRVPLGFLAGFGCFPSRVWVPFPAGFRSFSSPVDTQSSGKVFPGCLKRIPEWRSSWDGRQEGNRGWKGSRLEQGDKTAGKGPQTLRKGPQTL